MSGQRVVKLLLTAAALLLAGCNLSNDALLNYDWCYKLDFTTSDYGITPTRGNWVGGRGLVTDNDGYLEFSYTAPATVEPTGFIARIARATSSLNPISLSLEANIFGTHAGPATAQLIEASHAYTIKKSVSGGASDTLSIEAHTSEAMQLETLSIVGNLTSPWGSSNCDQPTGDPIDIPGGDIINTIKEADDELADASDNLFSPNGSNLTPNQQNLHVLFGYAKWLVSPSAANSLAGPFAPFIVEMGVLITVELVFLGIYLLVFLVVAFIRWVVWMIKLIAAIIQTVGSIVGGGIGFLLKFVGL